MAILPIDGKRYGTPEMENRRKKSTITADRGSCCNFTG